MSYKCFEYGVVGTPDDENLIVDELHRRQKFWNRLVEIERAARVESLKLLTGEVTQAEIDNTKARFLALKQEIKNRRKAARKKSVDVSDLQTEIAQLRESIKVSVDKAKAERAELKTKNKEHLDRVETTRREAVKEAYNASGLYWGNYNDEISSYNAARVAAMKAGVDLRFRSWTAEGKISVLFTSDPQATATAHNGENTRIQIDAVPEQTFTSPIRGIRRRLARTRGRIRLGSEGRNPRWIGFAMILHRPLPADGMIRQASLIRQRVGLNIRYKLVITVGSPDPTNSEQAVPSAPERITDVSPEQGTIVTGTKALVDVNTSPDVNSGTDIIAIDVGWRLVPEGLRVAYWADSAGDHGQIVLGPEILGQFRKIADLRSILDNKWNEFHKAFSTWWVQKSQTLTLWVIARRLRSS